MCACARMCVCVCVCVRVCWAEVREPGINQSLIRFIVVMHGSERGLLLRVARRLLQAQPFHHRGRQDGVPGIVRVARVAALLVALEAAGCVALACARALMIAQERRLILRTIAALQPRRTTHCAEDVDWRGQLVCCRNLGYDHGQEIINDRLVHTVRLGWRSR